MLLRNIKCKSSVSVGWLYQSLICLCCVVSRDKANSHCVFACACLKRPRKPVLTFLAACDPLLVGLTQSINKMSPKTNQKTKEMNPHLNKDNVIIVAV